MDSADAEKLLEQVARNLAAIEKLSRDLGELVDIEDRKVYGPMLKELLLSNFELQELIGSRFHDMHPSYLGLASFSQLKKQYEDPEHPIKLPSDEEITQAVSLWERLQKLKRKKL